MLNVPVLFSHYHDVTPEMLICSGGFVLFFISFFLFGPPVKSYIFEHELSHVLFALISGVKVKRMSLKNRQGYVKTEKVNIIIALAPYSFPLYTLCFIGIYKILSMITLSEFLAFPFYFLFGVSLSFHVLATIHYIQIEQPDLKRYGYFSSLIFIFTWSIIVLALIFALMFEKIAVLDFFHLTLAYSGKIYGKLFVFIRSITA